MSNQPVIPTFGYENGELGVSIENIMFAPDGRITAIPHGRLRRWWLSKRGYKLYVGHHFFPRDNFGGIISPAGEFDPPVLRVTKSDRTSSEQKAD